MFLIYSINAQNPRSPGEHFVHCVDTELADRFFVKPCTSGDHAVSKLANDLDDFIGDQTKDLTKPLYLCGVDNDALGARVIAEVVRKLPRYVTVRYATVSNAFRRGR